VKKQEQLRNPVRVKVDGKDVTRDTSVDDAYRVQKLMQQMNPDSKIEIVNVEPTQGYTKSIYEF
jgi:predicted LPLAT superfamily acyltransferase